MSLVYLQLKVLSALVTKLLQSDSDSESNGSPLCFSYRSGDEYQHLESRGVQCTFDDLCTGMVVVIGDEVGGDMRGPGQDTVKQS